MGILGRWFRNDERTKFWSWFAKHANGIAFPPEEVQLDELEQRLRKVHDGLAFQIGRLDGGLVLEISTDGNAQLIPVVQELCALAPKIRGWNVRAFRQPIPDARLAMHGRELSASDVSFVVDSIKAKADIAVFIEGLDADPEQLVDAGFLLLQAVAGELALLTKLGKIALVDAAECPDNARPLADLHAVLDGLGKASAAQPSLGLWPQTVEQFAQN